MSMPDEAVLTYDRLEPGRCIGTMPLAVDEMMLDHWQALYGYRPQGPSLPMAFTPLLLMRAMLTIATPRPPGNLHVGQSYRIARMPGLADRFVASVACGAKQVRKERRIVELDITLADREGAEPMIVGRSTIFWAR